jgi:hypothetical protein
MTERPQTFEIKRIRDVGTAHPFVNRIEFQFYRILDTNCIDLPKDRRGKIEEILHNCVDDLLRMEQLKEQAEKLEKEVIRKVTEEDGLKFQPRAISYDDPTLKLKEELEAFLIKGVIVCRQVAKIGSELFGKTLPGLQELRNHLQREFGNDHLLLEDLAQDEAWVKELYDLRAAVEHQELPFEPFSVHLQSERKLIINLASIKTLQARVSFVAYMTTTLENVFTFLEDITAALLSLKCIGPTRIGRVPENRRASTAAFKYEMTFQDDWLRNVTKTAPEDRSG